MRTTRLGLEILEDRTPPAAIQPFGWRAEYTLPAAQLMRGSPEPLLELPPEVVAFALGLRAQGGHIDELTGEIIW